MDEIHPLAPDHDGEIAKTLQADLAAERDGMDPHPERRQALGQHAARRAGEGDAVASVKRGRQLDEPALATSEFEVVDDVEDAGPAAAHAVGASSA